MCPVCFATAALIATGAISTAGVFTFAFTKASQKRYRDEIVVAQPEERSI